MRIFSGLSTTKEYQSWRDMVRRCNKSTDRCYKHYGGRGIKVFPLWEKDVSAFCQYMGPRPSKNHTIERIDNNGNYEPGNVRWATQIEQHNNTRGNRVLEVLGRKQTIAQWCNESGLKFNTVHARIFRYGWSVEKAIITPPLKRNRDYFKHKKHVAVIL